MPCALERREGNPRVMYIPRRARGRKVSNRVLHAPRCIPGLVVRCIDRGNLSIRSPRLLVLDCTTDGIGQNARGVGFRPPTGGHRCRTQHRFQGQALRRRMVDALPPPARPLPPGGSAGGGADGTGDAGAAGGCGGERSDGGCLVGVRASGHTTSTVIGDGLGREGRGLSAPAGAPAWGGDCSRHNPTAARRRCDTSPPARAQARAAAGEEELPTTAPPPPTRAAAAAAAAAAVGGAAVGGAAGGARWLPGGSGRGVGKGRGQGDSARPVGEEEEEEEEEESSAKAAGGEGRLGSLTSKASKEQEAAVLSLPCVSYSCSARQGHTPKEQEAAVLSLPRVSYSCSTRQGYTPKEQEAAILSLPCVSYSFLFYTSGVYAQPENSAFQGGTVAYALTLTSPSPLRSQRVWGS